MSPAADAQLVEAALTAFRDRDAEGRLVAAPAWWDLAPEERETLAQLQTTARALDRAHDPNGWSATVRAVMQRLE